MSTQSAPGIREAILAELKTGAPLGGPPSPQSVLQAAAKRLGIGYGNAELEQGLLTQWHELFRTGLLSLGLNLANPSPPHFHLANPGKRALANLTRDPSNPAGYLRHLRSLAQVDPVALSYLSEALDCYVAGFFKASAVMTGAAAESIILGLRDTVVRKLTSMNRALPRGISNWQVKT